MKKNKEIELNIEKTEFPGFGVGYYEGKKVKIKGSVKGEKVIAKITKARGKRIEAAIVEILEPSPLRKDPICPHYGVCGGCSNQVVPYDIELEYKKEQVLDLFEKGDIEYNLPIEIEKSPEENEYRNKMEYSFGDFVKDGDLTIGMHAKGSSFSVITTDQCKIVDEDFRKILRLTLDYFIDKEVKPYKVLSQVGYLRNLVVRKAKNTGEILINLVTTSQVDFNLDELLDLYKNQEYLGKLTGVLHTFNDSLSDAVYADSIDVLYGRDYIYEELLGLKFKISPLSFFQTNSKGAEKLYSIVRDFIGESKDKTIFDLYCGTGTIGQIVAKDAKKVIGIELIEEAVVKANENAKLNGLSNCNFIAGDVGKIVSDIKENPDVIILDPPRPGVSKEALAKVIEFNPKEIIYVSCNPKSLVENLAVLTEAGYEIKDVKLMDMFPHTPHVETVVLLRR
ncbi:MAG: 23S rRNA (uracil(1939)-C(5))-methyltransferase RlmD [Clostridiaceae bacterium]